MKTLFTLLTGCYISTVSFAQNINRIINVKKVSRIENVLASDDMRGRKTFTPEIDNAAGFIAAEFKKSGLKYFDGLNSYQQRFSMKNATIIFASGNMDGKPVDADKIFALTTDSVLNINENSGFNIVAITDTSNFFKAFASIKSNQKYLVLVNPAHEKIFQRLKSSGRESFEDKAPVVFVLTDEKPSTYHFEIKNKITSSSLSNVVGVLPGKSKANEYVIFSAHYDHLGVGQPDAKGDSIYNGANDDASGTTAVIMLAKYFSKLNNNERTLIFVTFTAEEIGGFGSQYFSKQIDPDKAVAMFNIEMIGTDSKWGNNSAYITGYERSDFGKILQSNLEGSAFHFEPDPYPKQNLFYRSDNATLAALGVPAHTISTSKMDNEPNYHIQSDEISTLDMKNMAEVIKAIAISSKTIVSGKDTPTRVEKR